VAGNLTRRDAETVSALLSLAERLPGG